MSQFRVGTRLFAGFSVPIVFLVVLALIGGGAAFFLMKKSQGDEEGEGDEAHKEAAHEPAPQRDPKVPPTFLPLDAMVVNLADEGGDGVSYSVFDRRSRAVVETWFRR